MEKNATELNHEVALSSEGMGPRKSELCLVGYTSLLFPEADSEQLPSTSETLQKWEPRDGEGQSSR